MKWKSFTKYNTCLRREEGKTLIVVITWYIFPIYSTFHLPDEFHTSPFLLGPGSKLYPRYSGSSKNDAGPVGIPLKRGALGARR